MANIGNLKVLIGANIDPLVKELKKTEALLKKTGKSFESVGDSALKMSAPILGVGAIAFKMASDFDDSMRKVQAVSGATGADFDQLRKMALDMGASTRFSASEAAAAMNYMGMAGWSTQQIMAGLPGVLNLAAASGEDLALVSDIVTDGMTAFGLAADQSGRFADVLAAASSAANTNVAMMGETFKYVAPVAGALGFSIEDSALAIGLMANAGIKGSQAGTALRAIMSRMVKPTKESQEAMDMLGLSVTNADGSMKPLNELLIELREKFGTLTPAQAASTAGMLAGQEAMSGMLALVSAAPEDFDKLQASITNSSGKAQMMAEIMEGGAGGAIRTMKSAIEGASISLGDAFAPIATKVVKIITDLANWFSSLSSGTKETIMEIALGVAVFGSLFKVTGMLIGGIGSMVGLYRNLIVAINAGTVAQLKMNAAQLASPIGLIIAAVAALAYGVYKLVTAYQDANVEAKLNAELHGEAEKAVLKERNAVDRLVIIADDHKRSIEERNIALAKLNQISGEHFKQLNAEELKTGDLVKAKDAYIETIMKTARARAAESKMIEAQSKLIDLEIQKQQDLADVKAGKGFFAAITNKEGKSRSIEREFEKEAEEIRKSIQYLSKELQNNPLTIEADFTPVKGGKTVIEDNITTPTTKAKNALELLEDKLKVTEEKMKLLIIAGKTGTPEYAKLADTFKEIKDKLEEANIEFDKATKKTKEMVQPLQQLGKVTGDLAGKFDFTKGLQPVEQDIKLTPIGGGNGMPQIDMGQLKSFIDGMKSGAEASRQVTESYEEQIQRMNDMASAGNFAATMVQDIGTAIMASAEQGATGMKSLADAALDAGAKVVRSFIMQGVSAAVSKALSFFPPPFNIAAGMVAGAAAGVIFNNLIGKIRAPKLAKGGLAYGPTMAMVGDNPGANVDPEVISPLSKLKDMINSQVTVNLAGNFKLAGRDLWLTVEQENVRQRRLSGS
jgi:TP901 family phage tail tape measure protein